MAYSMKNFEKTGNKVYVVIGDAEMQEGSNWEAMNFASYYKLDNVVVLVDCNRLGQSAATSLNHDVDAHAARFKAFGFNTLTVDGHDIASISEALKTANENTGSPTGIIFKTFKGHGMGEGYVDE